MRSHKITAVLIALAMLAVGGCASGSSTESSPSDDFHVTYMSSVSGAYAPFAAAIDASFQAAVAQVNADGGIMGRNVVVTTIDDGSDPTKAVNAAQTIVNDENRPDVVIPGITSLTTIPTLPIFARANIPTVTMATSTAGNDPSKFPLNFGTSSTPAQSSAGLMSHLKEQGITEVAVVITDNETGHSTLATLEQDAASAGISLTGTEAMAPTTVDATAALSSLQASDPQAVVVAGVSGPLAGTIFKDRIKLGWTIPTFTDVTTTANDLVSLAGGVENLTNVVYQELPYAVLGNPAQDTPAFRSFLAGFTAIMPNPKLPMGTLGAGWSGMAFIQAAFDKAGSTDPDEFAKAALSMQVADAPLWFQTSGPSFGLSSTDHYVAYGTYVYAPAGPRDSTGSLVVAGN